MQRFRYSSEKTRSILVISTNVFAVFFLCIVITGCTLKNQSGNSNTTNNDILGEDANKNGVRDDIEELIAAKFPESAKTRAVLLQAAAAKQTYLRDAASATATAENIKTISRATECAYAVIGERGREDLDWLHAQIHNTKARTDAYFQAQTSLGSTFIELADESIDSCDFDVSALPN